MIDAPTQGACFDLKAASLSMTLLELRFFTQQAFEDALREKIRQAPGFFKDLPVIISLEKFTGKGADIDFFQIIGICRRHGIQVVAVRGGDEDARRLARNASLAWMPASSSRKNAEAEAAQPAAPCPPARPSVIDRAVQPKADSLADDAQNSAGAPAAPSKIITQPIRSGQQIYALEGDLIILSPVSAGAELLAAGNIHVYGALRGRALAGVNGNTAARIFCHSLEAELVSIAGNYRISEDLQNSRWKQPAQIFLEDGALLIKPLE